MVGRERVELPEPEGNRFTVGTATTYGIPSQIDDHRSLFTLVPCYLVVWVGGFFCSCRLRNALIVYEGVVPKEGIEPPLLGYKARVIPLYDFGI